MSTTTDLRSEGSSLVRTLRGDRHDGGEVTRPSPLPKMAGMDSAQLLADVTAQGDVYAKAKAAAEEERARLVELVKVAAKGGVRQVDIVQATGWTREHIRQIVKGNIG